MKHLTFLLLILPIFTGCFNSQPPQGVVGQIVGCAETENAIFCLTEYTKTAEMPEIPETTDAIRINSTTLSAIVTDVTAGNTAYLNQTVTFTAEVRFNFALNDDPIAAITLLTGSDTISFFVGDYTETANVAPFVDYAEGSSYTFTVTIIRIEASTRTLGNTNIFAVLA